MFLIFQKKYFKRSGQQFVQAPQLVTGPASTPTQVQLSQTASASDVDASGQPSDGVAVPAPGKKTLEVKSPIVGTFYRSPGPDKPVFVKVGDTVVKGDVVCIIEAMKLFNEIESEVSGTIVKVLVEDASPVEYDQVLFLLEV